jgi:hypothetical protein
LLPLDHHKARPTRRKLSADDHIALKKEGPLGVAAGERAIGWIDTGKSVHKTRYEVEIFCWSCYVLARMEAIPARLHNVHSEKAAGSCQCLSREGTVISKKISPEKENLTILSSGIGVKSADGRLCGISFFEKSTFLLSSELLKVTDLGMRIGEVALAVTTVRRAWASEILIGMLRVGSQYFFDSFYITCPGDRPTPADHVFTCSTLSMRPSQDMSPLIVYPLSSTHREFLTEPLFPSDR